ncbi:MAG: DUF4143 domain-containing protein [Candidatus Methanoplasma sp.]|jgi:predicted AAA+ superfamily ATPase|nr:DUF4143 domain-containing protein [Candidatus Methanoplasma sp.]
MRLSLKYPDVHLKPRSTLIFFDEIQNCPGAMVSLKSFTIDGRFDVIASGSLMGVNYKEVSSYPVGHVNIFRMRSMDFEEFLWAKGVKDTEIGYVRSCIRNREPMDEFVLDVINGYHKEYLPVGGMPEAVAAFISTKNFHDVRTVHSEINEMCLSDVAKYAPAAEKAKVAACFRSIPAQLANDNKRFRYVNVVEGTNANSKTFGSSLERLREAGLVEYCHNLQEPTMPLAANIRPDAFKLCFHDTGLPTSMRGSSVGAAILDDDLMVNKGGIMENAVGEALAKNGVALAYFERKGRLEVDFIMEVDGAVTALEVKSGNNRQSKSLRSVMSDRYGVKRGIKLERSNICTDDDGVEHYPLFAASFVECLGKDTDKNMG